jgi:hypothetical protein
MRHQLSKISKLMMTHKPTTAVSTGTVSSTFIDTAGFLSVRAVMHFGSVSGDGVGTLSITGSTASAGSFNTLTGGSTSASIATTTGLLDGLLAIDVTNLGPNRYIKTNYTAATSLVNHGGIHIELYNPVNMPTTDDSTSMLKAQVVVTEAT